MNKCEICGKHTNATLCIECEKKQIEKDEEKYRKGTPTSLTEAIFNGLEEHLSKNVVFGDQTKFEAAVTISSHAKDFIRQQLGVLMISCDEDEMRAAEKLQNLLFKGE